MAHTVNLPSLGETVEEGEVLSWLVGIGDVVEEGEPIVLVSTDKAALEINADAAGRLTRQLVAEGDRVIPGAPIAEIEP